MFRRAGTAAQYEASLAQRSHQRGGDVELQDTVKFLVLLSSVCTRGSVNVRLFAGCVALVALLLVVPAPLFTMAILGLVLVSAYGHLRVRQLGRRVERLQGHLAMREKVGRPCSQPGEDLEPTRRLGGER